MIDQHIGRQRRDLPGPYVRYLERLAELNELRVRMKRLQDRIAYLEARAGDQLRGDDGEA
jgi:hypothetical protein